MIWKVHDGGTGAPTAAGARINLGLGPDSTPTFTDLTLTGNANIGGTLSVTGLSTLAATTITGAFALTGDDVQVSEGGTGVSAITGLVSGNGTSNFVGRTITGTANEITVTNGSGATANPTLSLPTALTFTGKTVTGGTFNSTFNGTIGSTTPAAGFFTTLSASNTVTFSAPVVFDSANPFYRFIDNDAAVNEKVWQFYAPASRFRIQTLTDDFSTGSGQIFDIIRSGNTITNFQFGAPGGTWLNLASTIATFGSSTVVDVNSGQIKFPAVQNPSGDANTLDDYEENTFTPVVEGTTTAGVGTYTTQTGQYTKIGRVVYISLTVTVTAHTGTGNLQISGLPFTVGSQSYVLASDALNLALTANNYLSAVAVTGTTTIQLRQIPTGGGAVGIVPMDTSFTLRLTGFYFV